MTDASLLAAGAVLMQMDENSDLHPCAYFSCTFSSTQCNYDIYDHELLAVILALEEWCQYLQGTTHSVTIITNHKNLSYIKDPQKLSRQQAKWSFFLQDFDLGNGTGVPLGIWGHTRTHTRRKPIPSMAGTGLLTGADGCGP